MCIEFNCEKCNTRFKREYDYKGKTAPCKFCSSTTLFWRTIKSFQDSLHCTTCNPPHNPDFNKILWTTVTIPPSCSECGGDKFYKFVG